MKCMHAQADVNFLQPQAICTERQLCRSGTSTFGSFTHIPFTLQHLL